MPFTLWLWAGFAALQAGALVICLAMMLLENGLAGIFEGFGVWVFAQIFVLPLALLLVPVLTLLRWALGRLFIDPRSVGIWAGCALGILGAAALTFDVRNVESVLRAVFLGALGGCVGGWVWWRIERPYLEIARGNADNK